MAGELCFFIQLGRNGYWYIISISIVDSDLTSSLASPVRLAKATTTKNLHINLITVSLSSLLLLCYFICSNFNQIHLNVQFPVIKCAI